MNYAEALNYIHSTDWTKSPTGLFRIRELCERLGDPQDKLKFIHVAGTNGKGSFCAMTDSILRQAGYKVGLFTSPYILKFNERIRINGENISDSELCALVEEIKPYADKMQDKPTEFELITAIAFLYFLRNKCDIVVLECGLGGRLDATNIIKTPILSVITGIALDHTSILGDSIEKIAAEKAGIIKEGIPLLWCGDNEIAEQVIADAAKAKGAPIYKVDRSLLKTNEMTLDGTFFDFGKYENLSMLLLGSYQPKNASNVLSAMDLLDSAGIKVSDGAVREGLRHVIWQARFEIISRDPLIIADGAHNPDGIDGAVDSIRRYFPDKRVVIVTGVMADKDYRYMASKIGQVAECVFCLTPDNARALRSDDYAEVFGELGVDAMACDSVNDAVAKAVSWAKKTESPVVCLGSLYMYGEIVAALKK